VSHVSEEDLVLYHYGELPHAGAVEAHVESCTACRDALASTRRVLGAVDALPVPERGDDYPARILAGVEDRVSRRTGFLPRLTPTPGRLAWAAGVALLVVAAFLVGRLGGRGDADVPPEVREKILLLAVGDHLERSERLLVELVNAEGTPFFDIADQQGRAKKLVSDSRLYRATAMRSGDTEIAELLERLERLLIDISNGPSRLAGSELGDLRRRIENRDLLLRIRLLGDGTRERVRRAPSAGEV